MDQTLLPLIIAAVGVFGVCVAAGISATSTIRVRLIDIQTQEASEKRAFHVRMVAAINEAGSSVEDLIKQLLTRLDSTERHSLSARVVTAEEAQLRFEQLNSFIEGAIDAKASPGVQKRRLSMADEQWDIAVAESHIYTESEAYNAIRAFSVVRVEVHRKVLTALTVDRVEDAVANLRAASEMHKTWMRVQGTIAYHQLQIDRMSADRRVFMIAQVFWLKEFAKMLHKGADAEIERKKNLIQDIARRG